MVDDSRDPPRQPFSRRLGTYLFGVAIGLVILGFIQLMRAGAVQRQQTPGPNPPASAPGPADESP